MISRRSLAMILMMAVMPLANADAQVRRLGNVPVHASSVQPACHGCGGCAECGGGHYGGVVWGTQCLDCGAKPGLFPPCPNPCRTTLVGELVFGVKHAVDRSLSKVFHCVFNCAHCLSCGYDTCQCGGAYDVYEGEVVYDDGVMVDSEPQPMPSPSRVEGDPFGDDPLPQGSGSRSSLRSLVPVPKVSGPAATRRSVRRVSYPQAPQRRVRATATSRQSTARNQTMVRPTSAVRPIHPQLQAVRVETNESAPVLKFRDER